MRNKLLPLATSLALLGALGATAARADEAWDHRAMQSHHQDVDRAERPLAPGERRIGRITIGAISASPTSVPETIPSATQRQWVQRGSFGDSTPSPAFNAPRVQAARHDNTPGAYVQPGR